MTDPKPEGRPLRSVLGGIGAVVVVLLCCGGPVLLGAGALGVVAAALTSPWALAAPVLILLVAGAVGVRYYCKRRSCQPPLFDQAVDHRAQRAKSGPEHS